MAWSTDEFIVYACIWLVSTLWVCPHHWGGWFGRCLHLSTKLLNGTDQRERLHFIHLLWQWRRASATFLRFKVELNCVRTNSIMTKTYLGLRHSGRLAFVFLKFQLCTLLSFLPGHALCFCSFFLEITTKPKRLESLTYWYILYITW